MTDIDLALHMVVLAGRYDEAVLVSGDKDFLPVVAWARLGLRKRIFVVSWRHTISRALLEEADGFTFLDDHLEGITEN